MNHIILTITLLGALSLSANAAVILADDFADVGDAQKTGNTATFGSWNTDNGITTPATSLSFFDDDGTTALSFHEATDGELDVDNNMTAGGWDTSFSFSLDGATSTIDLTTLVLDMRLTTGSGADNVTSSKTGQILAVLEGSVSGALETADLGGNIAYPSVTYQRTLDLSSFADLDNSETYTITIQARGEGFGHHKSLQGLALNGTITPIPEPSSTALLGLAGLALILRRRRA